MLNEMRCLAVLLTPLGNLSHCEISSFMERSRVAEEKITANTVTGIASSTRFMLN